MSSHDAMRSLFVDRKPVRVGVREVMIWPETIEAWISQGYPAEDVRQPDGSLRRPGVDWVSHFGFDAFRVGESGVIDATPLLGYREVLGESDEWIITRNGAGAAYKTWKHHSGMHEHIDFHMTSRQVWEKDYRPHLLAVNRARINLVATKEDLERRRTQGLWTYYQQGLLWQHMSGCVGLLTFLEKLIEDPDWMHDFNRVHVDFYKAHFNILFDEVGVPDAVRLIDDFAYINGLMSSPRIMRELYLPYYKEMVDFFHAHNMLVQLHVCGGVTAAVPMLVEAGVDILDPLEAKAGVDPLALTERFGDQLAFVGGMDVRVLEAGDRAAIKREVVRLTRGMIERGGRYVWGSDHSVPPTVAYQDYLYALETCREHGSY